MSRIGKKPVEIPAGVEVAIHANKVTVKGPKGTLELTTHYDVKVVTVENEVRVEKVGTSKRASAIWGTTTKLIANMVEGVTKEFEKKLELNGVGYRMSLSGKKLNLALGFSHPVDVVIPDGINAKVEGNILSLTGIDKREVGQLAAEIRQLRPVEPYKGKGFRYVGEMVRRKEGKKAAS